MEMSGGRITGHGDKRGRNHTEQKAMDIRRSGRTQDNRPWERPDDIPDAL